MPTSDENSNPNKTMLYFNKISNFLIIFGALPGYLKWRESGYTRTIYKYIQNVITICIYIFIAMELGSLITQKNLSDKQAGDMLIMGFSHLILSSYPYVIEYHKERVKDLIYKLCVEMKNVYNDPEVERQMIKKSNIYSVAFLINLSSALISYGFDGLMQAVRGGTFVTVVTAWPDVTDKSITAAIGRVVGYLMWWLCMARVAAIFLLIIGTTGCLSYQFKNLQSYFYSLNNTFAGEGASETEQKNAEQKYEKALKVGIQLHSDTLWCTSQCQVLYSFVYSAQIITNVFVIAMLMLQMVSTDRTLATAFAIVVTSIALLTGTGILMWNAGDVTVEAALVPTAMYASGWQNCRGKSSQRVRKLLVIAMDQAQRPVILRSFGIMDISYQAYVSVRFLHLHLSKPILPPAYWPQHKSGTFVTVVTAWPDVTDKSITAAIGRVVGYLMWWLCMARVAAIFLLIIGTTGCLSYQFKNLQSYFYSLNNTFAGEGASETEQKNAEQKYEKALKVGIQLHSDTLWCTSQCQVLYSFVYSAQIITNVFVIAMLMLQMVSTDRTLATAFAIVVTSIALLTGTGILMWNAGDVTVEAALVPTAMYASGWQNCRGKSSQRVRKLLVIAMDQAQRPVILRSFGIMDISYQAYVSMVKASYSAFSLLY